MTKKLGKPARDLVPRYLTQGETKVVKHLVTAPSSVCIRTEPNATISLWRAKGKRYVHEPFALGNYASIVARLINYWSEL